MSESQKIESVIKKAEERIKSIKDKLQIIDNNFIEIKHIIDDLRKNSIQNNN